MLEFLKKIFSSQDRKLTFMVFDDGDPGSSTSYEFEPSKMILAFYGVLVGVIILMLLLVIFTPLGSLGYIQEDKELKSAVIEIREKVTALKDSLEARDMQMAKIQQVLAAGSDTTFEIRNDYRNQFAEDDGLSGLNRSLFSRTSDAEVITQNEIIFSGLLKNAPEFPASYPVEGTFTRGYNPETKHYGIDIATRDQTPFRAIADGVVVNQDWTVNFGYVLHIQHGNGLLSVYKHASDVSRSAGDIVLKGDIVGTVGDAGVMSSGPHLHMEIWKNGVPQNPSFYLIKS